MITELVGCRDVSRWSNGIFEEALIRSYQINEADDDVLGQYVKNAVPYSVNMIISIGVEKRYCSRNFKNIENCVEDAVYDYLNGILLSL